MQIWAASLTCVSFHPTGKIQPFMGAGSSWQPDLQVCCHVCCTGWHPSLSTNRERFIAIGLWVGYIAYGFTFPYNFITHDYYHLPIILVVAFGMIPVAISWCDP